MAGIGRMATGQLRDHLRAHWETLQAKLVSGTHVPQPGAAGGNTQTHRRNQNAGYADSAGSVDIHGAVSRATQPVVMQYRMNNAIRCDMLKTWDNPPLLTDSKRPSRSMSARH